MPSNKAPCRLTLRVGTMRRIGLPLASIPAIRTCSFACIRGSRRFPILAALLSRPASTASGLCRNHPVAQDGRCRNPCNTQLTARSVTPLKTGTPSKRPSSANPKLPRSKNTATQKRTPARPPHSAIALPSLSMRLAPSIPAMRYPHPEAQCSNDSSGHQLLLTPLHS